MVELLPGSGVYLHQDQQRIAMSKTRPYEVNGKKKTQGTDGPGVQKDSKSNPTQKNGVPAARYLLTLFIKKEELAKSSLTASESAKYPCLNSQIVETIVGEYWHIFR